MATAVFHHRPERNDTLVYLSMYCADGRLRVSTEISLDRTHLKKGQIVSGKKNREAMEAISRLENLRMKINQHITSSMLNDRPIMKGDIDKIVRKPQHTAKLITEQLKAAPKTGRLKRDINDSHFLLAYEKLIKDAENGILRTPKEGKRYTPNSLKVWYTNKRLLGEFSREKNLSIEPDDMTLDTINKFNVWMNDKGYALNYVGIANRQWKYVVKLLKKRGYHTSDIHNDEEWTPRFEEIKFPYCTDVEVEKMWRHKCKNGEQEHARDRWVLEYCTGLRVSDSLRLSIENFGDNNITVVTTKKNKKVVIPYHPILEELIAKYDGQMPPKMSEQKINENMKKVAQDAGINTVVTYSKTIGGELKIFKVPKYETITNHTARRSLVSNMILDGTGHDIGGDIVGMSAATWSKYNKVEAERKAEMVQQTKLFQPKPKLRKVS